MGNGHKPSFFGGKKDSSKWIFVLAWVCNLKTNKQSVGTNWTWASFLKTHWQRGRMEVGERKLFVHLISVLSQNNWEEACRLENQADSYTQPSPKHIAPAERNCRNYFLYVLLVTISPFLGLSPLTLPPSFFSLPSLCPRYFRRERIHKSMQKNSKAKFCLRSILSLPYLSSHSKGINISGTCWEWEMSAWLQDPGGGQRRGRRHSALRECQSLLLCNTPSQEAIQTNLP